MRFLVFPAVILLASAAHAQSPSERNAVAIDTNRDGAVSREEFIAMARDHSTRADKDHNGRLEGAERSPRLPATTVTIQDYIDSGLKIFDSHDVNHDGRLEGGELKSFWDEINRNAPTGRN